ncbi:hypothetical protein RZS08_49125, partial [Arthrospira platensis SPKY1]|nr:hypothetical protein [Arthrospira platensis SPKY1]
VRVGQSYANALKNDIATVEAMSFEDELMSKARENVLSSLKKSLAAVESETENADYTKRGKYTRVANGVNVFEDGTFELRGFVHSKTVLAQGNHKVVNSRPLTTAQNTIKKG